MGAQVGGNKPFIQTTPVKNGETSATIGLGTPVALTLSGTDDGLAVVLPSTATATKAGVLGYGVTIGAIAAGAMGQVQVFGFCRNVRVLTRTRSASSTAAWASQAAFAVGDVLVADTVNDCFSKQAVPSVYTTGSAASDTLGINFKMFAPMAVIGQAVASNTTLASTSGSATFASSTASYSLVKVFLRML